MAEHITRNDEVVGSIPTTSSKKPCDLSIAGLFVIGDMKKI